LKRILLLSFLFTIPLFAGQPYHLHLEASPAAAFPYLGKFGTVWLHVYAGGVRVQSLGLDSFSKNGANAVTVMNPVMRMYADFPMDGIAPALTKLAGSEGSIQRISIPKLAAPMKGKVLELDATRYRLVYGPQAWIDLWTTDAVPVNPQLRRIVGGMLEGISPGTWAVVKNVPGTPVYVELNFRRFRKLNLLKLKKLNFSADDEQSALEVGRFYMRAPLVESLF